MTDTTYTPRFPVPKGACDCHYHVFGPAARYAPKPEIRHLMPDALAVDHAAMRARVGLERMVLVQVGGYYPDNQPMLEVLAAEGDKMRGVAAYDPAIEADEIASLNAAGARGMRVSPGRDLSDDRLDEVWSIVMRLAKLFEPVGWHIQFLLSGHMRDALLPRLKDVPVPVVIDHLGLFRPERTDGHKGYEAFLKAMESANTWTKVSGADRVTRDGNYENAIPIMRDLIAVAPERLVWGTDWPHTPERPPLADGEGPVTLAYTDVDENKCISVLADACPDEATFKAILVDNPARLYGFE
ncbi:MAG: hypothetical protein CMM59_20900 [Rhodospirillaceae bacterium]|nr:hypothetical protein [Rhodospirillaceae bacterium]